MKAMTKKWWLLPVMGVFIGLASGCVKATQGPGPASASVSEPAAGAVFVKPQPQDAMAVLKNMADFLSRTKSFSVTLREGYDVVQASGQKIWFGETRQITLERPRNLRVDLQQSDGSRAQLVYDGREIDYFSSTDNIYSTTPKPGGVDDAVKYLVKDLRLRLPLAMMVLSTFPAELEQRVTSADYVEFDTLTTPPSHHVAARTKEVDFQVWVAAEGNPLPLQVVITYKYEEGQPQFRSEFENWNLAPSISPSLFAFTPPRGAEKIPFLVDVRETMGAVQKKGGK
jgi:hypothetical protein